MGNTRQHPDVLLIAAVISRNDKAFDWAEQELASHWGPIISRSTEFDFSETRYYLAEMGEGLRKQFFAFRALIDPARLPDQKRLANDLEARFAREHSFPEQRPINIDPGYISVAKLVLATTKNHSHRVYLRDGIFAEVTLHRLKSGEWSANPWTYPDYRRKDYHEFFTSCWDYLRSVGQ